MIDFKLGVAAKAAVAVAALTSVSAFAQNLPDFTFAPAGAGLNGASVTADNIIISDYSRVVIAADGTFTDSGFLAVEGFQLNGTNVIAGGLNSTYGLYFDFDATGTQTTNNPFTTANTGTFTTLTFTLYGYNGPAATFTPDSTTAAGTVALATGTLIPGQGGVATLPAGAAGYSPSAFANANFTTLVNGFFASPNPFYGVALSTFSNTTSEVNVISANEFTIFQGGGAVNFAAPIPEPQTYALMLAGLGVVAFIARRRQRV